MPYLLLTGVVVIVHVAFIALVALGAPLLIRWPRLIWIQVPSALWGMTVSISGWTCPLTPLEKTLRDWGGVESYDDPFINHYLLQATGFGPPTPSNEGWVIAAVATLNLACWTWVWVRGYQRQQR